MKDAIEFVKHGVLNRQYDEQLTQVHACGNHIQSFNGIVRMSHKLPGIGTFSVVSTQLLNAIKACDYEPTTKLTDHNLIITKGKFRAMIPYSKDHTREPQPKGKYRKIKSPLMEGIKVLYPFISEDASRAWSQSFMVKKGYMYATNNVIVARTKTTLKDCILPVQLLAVMMKIKRDPIRILITEGNITVDYGDDSWIRSAVSSEPWPDVTAIFKQLKFKKLDKFTKEFREAIDLLSAFCSDDIIGIKDGKIMAETGEYEGVDLPDCCFTCSNMKKILSTFTHVDFGKYPEPMPIKGDNIEGAFVGRIM